MSVEGIINSEENQKFIKLDINTDPKIIVNHIIALANTQGGDIVLGITENNKLEGIDGHEKRISDLIKAPFYYCFPTVKFTQKILFCFDKRGRPNNLLVIHVNKSEAVHHNQNGEVFCRYGSVTKKLSFEERLQLSFNKSEKYFEETPIKASIEDIDLGFLKKHLAKMKYSKSETEYLNENGFFTETKNGSSLTAAAALLFGKTPQSFFPNAVIRFMRYDGINEKAEITDDVIFDGKISDMVHKTIDFLLKQLKKRIYLNEEGGFMEELEYPEFVMAELVVNAVSHRDYSLGDRQITIKMFNDRMVFDVPGKLPSLVEIDNMRSVHFSRNPKTASFLRDLGLASCSGAGTDKIFNEMEASGLNSPEYRMNSFSLIIVLRNKVELSFAERSAIKAGESPSGKAINGRTLPFGYKKPQFEAFKEFIKGINPKLSSKIILRIWQIYEKIEPLQIFSRLLICGILKCSSENSGRIIHIMKDLDIIESVSGHGKGYYVFTI